MYFQVLQLAFPLETCAVARRGHRYSSEEPEYVKRNLLFFFSFTQDIFTQVLHDVSPFSHNLLSDCQSPALANSGMVNIAGK